MEKENAGLRDERVAQECVMSLIEKSDHADSPIEATQYAQAALDAAKAYGELVMAWKDGRGTKIEIRRRT